MILLEHVNCQLDNLKAVGHKIDELQDEKYYQQRIIFKGSSWNEYSKWKYSGSVLGNLIILVCCICIYCRCCRACGKKLSQLASADCCAQICVTNTVLTARTSRSQIMYTPTRQTDVIYEENELANYETKSMEYDSSVKLRVKQDTSPLPWRVRETESLPLMPNSPLLCPHKH